MYKVTDTIEAQYKDEIGIDIHVGIQQGMLCKDITVIKIRSNIAEKSHFDKIGKSLEQCVRTHLRKLNQLNNQIK